jgi:hypothetical protein
MGQKRHKLLRLAAARSTTERMGNGDVPMPKVVHVGLGRRL